ncbi:hypothetical protein [uncultured Cedecea sp.]|uniref:hypothetical protein n=1 Tax=uncultured Cedecea sp. TaxID=988762 RepID=UPI0026328FC2|nr:hypothetical protein [uncultured Cedecea sp.]
MQQTADSIARIFYMPSEEIVNLHFTIKNKVLDYYESGYNEDNLNNAIWLSEKAVAISSLVMAAMINKHKHDCDEYLRIMGMPHPGIKFYYPAHPVAEKLIALLEQQGRIMQAEYVANKVASEGWGCGKYIELSDL